MLSSFFVNLFLSLALWNFSSLTTARTSFSSFATFFPFRFLEIDIVSRCWTTSAHLVKRTSEKVAKIRAGRISLATRNSGYFSSFLCSSILYVRIMSRFKSFQFYVIFSQLDRSHRRHTVIKCSKECSNFNTKISSIYFIIFEYSWFDIRTFPPTNFPANFYFTWNNSRESLNNPSKNIRQ